MSISRLLIGGVVVSLAIGGMSAFKRPASSSIAVQSPSPSPPPAQSLSAPVPAPDPTPGYRSQRISSCAGVEANANFRSYPSFDPASIVGVVANGDVVLLTGRVMQSEGEVWYEAIAPIIYSASDLSVASQFTWNQPGWISACFVGE